MEKIVSHSKYSAFIIGLLLCFTNIGHAQNADIRLLHSINSHRTAGMDGVMSNLSTSAYVVPVVLPVTQLIVGLCRHDTQTVYNTVQTASSLLLTVGLAFGLKYAVNRPRPYATYAYINPYTRDADPSFPSGHTSIAFSTATALSLEYKRWYVVVPSFLWAGAVGYSRLYLGMHYPTDVLAGAVLGAGSSWLCYKGTQWLQHRNKTKRHAK